MTAAMYDRRFRNQLILLLMVTHLRYLDSSQSGRLEVGSSFCEVEALHYFHLRSVEGYESGLVNNQSIVNHRYIRCFKVRKKSQKASSKKSPKLNQLFKRNLSLSRS